MGKTAFSGPVYGAKSLLFTHSLAVGTTSASTILIAPRRCRPTKTGM
jgi:hypothetical protein